MSTEPLEWMAHESELGLSVWEIGAKIFQLTNWIEKEGNRGYPLDTLTGCGMGKALIEALLQSKYKTAWQDILFEAEAQRRSDFHGWGVHKYKPQHWTRTWLQRFGTDNVIAQKLINDAHDEALIEYEARKVKRKVEYAAGIKLDEMTTREVAYYGACFDVMAMRARHRGMMTYPRNPVLTAMMRVYAAIWQDFMGELIYRVKADPEPRSSKKKTLLAKEDWAQAEAYRESGTEHFFSAAYIQHCKASQDEPDLTVDFDDLPRRTIPEMPIVKLSDKDLVAEFMKLLNSTDDFEREDAQLILRTLRPMLARAKGQHGTVDLSISTSTSTDEAEV